MNEEYITHVEIGKSVIERLFRCSEVVGMDDEIEFFPVVKTIISGISDTLDSDSASEEIENRLKGYLKELYIARWLSQAEEEEQEYDVEYETSMASEEFEYLYSKVKGCNDI